MDSQTPPLLQEVTLPANRAFVVQFRAQRLMAEELFVGRAEHMATGTTARFTRAEELIAFITKVLAQKSDGGAE